MSCKEQEVEIKSNKIANYGTSIMAIERKYGIVHCKVLKGKFLTKCCNLEKDYNAVWTEVTDFIQRLGFKVEIRGTTSEGDFNVYKVTIEKE